MLRTGWWIVPVVLGALAIRLWNLGWVGFNSDEAVYAGQAANLAGYSEYARHFSPFRAHPLLFQLLTSIVYRFSFGDVQARVVSAVFGAATVLIVYLLGSRLYSRRAGLIAAAILAVMPYHVIVSRQALLEAPMTFFFTLTIYLFAKYLADRQWMWAYAMGIAAGLSFLTKEIGVLALVVVMVYSLLFKGLSLRHALSALASFLIVSSSFFISAFTIGRGGSYVLWQISRPPNHPPWFYFENFPVYLGYPLLILFLAGLFFAMRRRTLSSNLTLVWIGVTFTIFQFLPLKGFHYILPIAPVISLMAAYPLAWWWRQAWRSGRIVVIVIIVLTLSGSFFLSLSQGVVSIDYSRLGLAGYSGLPQAREAALWIRENTPEGAVFMTINPTMMNIIRFYADRDAFALSVSPNPLKRNPAYIPIRNPDYMLRTGLIQYLVYDTYSAARTSHFANRLLGYVNKYNAVLEHAEYDCVALDEEGVVCYPVILIYRVHIGLKR